MDRSSFDKGGECMIYTVTLNPSIDYIVYAPSLKIGELNHSEKEYKYPGGKGINVSRVLNNLGHTSIATGFLGGFTGEFITTVLKEEQVKTDFIMIADDTRINIKLKGIQETEINGTSPIIEEKDIRNLTTKLEQLQLGDTLVLAGSIPKGVDEGIYRDLIKKGKAQGANVILDASGIGLKEGVKERPFLIKPNHHEIGQLFNKPIDTLESAIPLGQRLVADGVENIIISFAAKGAVFINENNVFFATVPNGEVKNSVGAGDSVVAGFIAHYLETNDVIASFRYGIAAGSASAFSDGFCTKDSVSKLLNEVEITAWKG